MIRFIANIVVKQKRDRLAKVSTNKLSQKNQPRNPTLEFFFVSHQLSQEIISTNALIYLQLTLFQHTLQAQKIVQSLSIFLSTSFTQVWKFFPSIGSSNFPPSFPVKVLKLFSPITIICLSSTYLPGLRVETKAFQFSSVSLLKRLEIF